MDDQSVAGVGFDAADEWIDPTVDHVPGLWHIVFLVEDRGAVRHGRVEADKAGDECP